MWMTDLLKQNIFMCLRVKDEKQERKERDKKKKWRKKLSQAYFGVYVVFEMMARDEEEDAICCMHSHRGRASCASSLHCLVSANTWWKLPTDRVMNWRGCNEIERVDCRGCDEALIICTESKSKPKPDRRWSASNWLRGDEKIISSQSLRIDGELLLWVQSLTNDSDGTAANAARSEKNLPVHLPPKRFLNLKHV